ncbi:uncharacterized protein RHIMIDRAFT_120768 [Rhizopus microsporus ATCC 52813]|uniref:Uncharacterized protein n=1 Tax=Rhizopus microsporus ATCC 52813 TaxID=1340429 RepID=A0A2G4SXH7_RHIZD|nr:uncharacterized protein RHIMIDRAFT_120768 [Rhizopus microsporus ATCC 52813]PHZ13490.1 hypothetical protein RHIMIDRAFT_120768 [Rhizopus microsporus ATCC 52813]
MKNRMPTLPVSKVSLNNGPFKILPVLRHILEQYENLHMAQPSPIDKDNASKFVPPRLFSLFPNPGLGWRFIKVDAQNLTGILPEAKQEKQINESPFDHNQRQFFQMFDFKKLGFRSWEELKNMPEQRGRMFLNGMYTDDYTCSVLFCRKVLLSSVAYGVSLELSDFTTDEVDKYFRPCTVDPGRKDAFVSYHGGTDIRRLSSAEYYSMSGTVNRQKAQQGRKQSLGIESIETNIPSPKTASTQRYMLYITYILQHMDSLFNFYNFETTKLKWLNYIGSQEVIQESVNILLNGGKKYNKSRRKNTKKNRKKKEKSSKTCGTHASYHTIRKVYTLFLFLFSTN